MGLKLVGITGKALSGKDTLAKFLVEEHGFMRMAFADPIKVAVAASFDYPIEIVFSDAFKKHYSTYWNMTGREMLQKFGTEAMRNTFGKDHWVKRWLVEYAKVCDHNSVVITDVREEHEAKEIRALGGLIIHIHRDSAGLTGSEGNHSSEKGIDFHERDIKVDNNSTLEHLEHQAYLIIQLIEQQAQAWGLRNETLEA